ncbi:MAG TPA: glycoside hydrolase/phage tail family protein [Mesorhizobium sp.]|jgi:hypothetical protein|nr:glycoside hydrolase/phage tail family protein [Mesorhizobium sp.]
MATVILQAAGAALGGLFGPVGAALGTAAGALAGYAVDRALLGGERHVEGARLNAQKFFTAEEGAALPRVYGAARVGGTLIWATRFEEKRQTRRQGGKGAGGGGAKVTEYSYYANAAFGLCEGPIAGVRRVWADGRELDLTEVELRVHRGTEDQLPDPLIAVKQGEGFAPAYRGTAYAVVERLPIGDFGNRLPQLQFEMLRPVGRLHEDLRAVCLIPGATEYGLSPELVTREIRGGEDEALNRHVLYAESDFEASLDELQALCPKLEHVALVATWFGDDLRAEHCRIRPMVTDKNLSGFSEAWRVSGLSRGEAAAVSRHGGGAAYGGTPSDRSVIAAIEAIKARGLKVTLYPFVMMDVPQNNGLPDPYGAPEQAAYPWRGRITVSPAPGRAGTPDKTAGARTAVAAFCGATLPGHFDADGQGVDYSGPSADWGYRRLVLHYARIAQAAGGVDAFLLGSELRGLTSLRDGAGAFPFVEELCRLAGEAREILGPATKLTYGADWSEYFGHQPADGSGDRLFHLDALWAHSAISAVGIDNYMPLSDWRDGDLETGNPDDAKGQADPAALRAAIRGGEGFDWFYPDEAARAARARAAITDGAYGKPWVFRPKDLWSWWAEPHFQRIGGVEAAQPTAWVPKSKPIWLTELGCPAVDKGANQPNVFPDPKSAESALPHFSNGGRNDLVQRRFLEAHLGWWCPDAEGFAEADNPVSPAYGGRMLDFSRIYAWAWDARPFPAFPARADRWADGANWTGGHWLNGRLDAPAIADLIQAILRDHGLPAADVAQAEGSLQGYVCEPGAAREQIEPLADLFGLSIVEGAEGFAFRADGALIERDVDPEEMVLPEDGAALERVREPDRELPTEAVLSFRDAWTGYQAATARAFRESGGVTRRHATALPAVMEPAQASALASDWLRRQWAGREELRFALSPEADVEPGMLLRLAESGDPFQALEVEKGLVRSVRARRRPKALASAWAAAEPPQPNALNAPAGRPLMLFLDLPANGSAAAPEERFRVAMWQKPWRPQALFASPDGGNFALRTSVPHPATAGRLLEPLRPGVSGRFDRASKVMVELNEGAAASVSREQLLAGANAPAVRSAAGAWEVLQFEEAEEVAPGVFRLSNLLRGQLGTEDAAEAGAPAGADAVMLDDALVPAGLRAGEAGRTLVWRGGPSGRIFSDRFFASQSVVGGVRARLPLRPAHISARPEAGGIRFTWVRRGRVDADAWEGDDVPLGEEREAYLVEVAPAGGAPVRQAEAPAPNWLYGAAELAADFPTLPAALDLRVRQRGTGVGWGLQAAKSFALPIA